VSPQVIHAHFGPDAAHILPTAERQSIPLIATFHGADATSMWRGCQQPIFRRRLQRLFARAHTLHAVSDFIANQLIDLGAPPEKVRRVYIGIPCGGGEVRAYGGSQKSVLFVGRLVEKKGLGDLLEAMSQLPEKLRGTKLHVIGDGPLKQRCMEEAADRRLNAVFHGAQSPEFVFKHMKDSTLFCVPSKTASNGDSEGLGMVFLEAGLHSLPTVSYLHGGVPEAVCDGVTGLLAPEGDVAALAQHLGDMLSHPQKASQFGIAAHDRVLRLFNMTEQAAHMEELYDRASESTYSSS
jgi:glycosyltransferase involved in cell wall biosynthesis